MKFTDNDLLVLLNGSKYFEGGEQNEYRKMIVAMAHRLKCAERVCEEYQNSMHPAQGYPMSLKFWRSSKGER